MKFNPLSLCTHTTCRACKRAQQGHSSHFWQDFRWTITAAGWTGLMWECADSNWHRKAFCVIVRARWLWSTLKTFLYTPRRHNHSGWHRGRWLRVGGLRSDIKVAAEAGFSQEPTEILWQEDYLMSYVGRVSLRLTLTAVISIQRHWLLLHLWLGCTLRQPGGGEMGRQR